MPIGNLLLGEESADHGATCELAAAHSWKGPARWRLGLVKLAIGKLLLGEERADDGATRELAAVHGLPGPRGGGHVAELDDDLADARHLRLARGAWPWDEQLQHLPMLHTHTIPSHDDHHTEHLFLGARSQNQQLQDLPMLHTHTIRCHDNHHAQHLFSGAESQNQQQLLAHAAQAQAQM